MNRLPYYSPEMDRQVMSPSPETTGEVSDLLSDPRLHAEIAQGNVTLAMIRPNVGPEANLSGLPDAACAEVIEGMITDVGVLAKFSFTFTPEAVAEFYQGGPKDSMSREDPINPAYKSRWPEFVDFMASGPTTALLLHSPKGDAIGAWRAQLGHWNIDEVRDPATIRGKLGVNKFNNLLHGSDAPESVLREIGIIARCIDQKTTLH